MAASGRREDRWRMQTGGLGQEHINAEQAARLAGFPARTILRWAREGRIACRWSDRRCSFLREDVEDACRCVNGPP